MSSVCVGDIVRNSARTYPHREALIAGHIRLTYAELVRRIDTTAAALKAAGVEQGTRVVCLAKNSTAVMTLYFATADLGAILVPMNYWQRPSELADVLNDVEPAIFFHDDEFADLAAAAVDKAAETYAMVRMPAWGVTDESESEWVEFLAGGASTAYAGGQAAYRPRPDDAHLILYTSGTTGRPKGAILTHEGTVMSAFSVALGYRLRQVDSFVALLTPFHIAAWGHINPFLLVGGSVAILPEFNAERAYETMVAERSTIFIAAPIMCQQILALPQFDRDALSDIRLIVFGAFDPSGVMRRVGEIFGASPGGPVQMLHGYGITEGGVITISCPPEEVFEKWGSIGKASVGYAIRLVHEGEDVPQGEPGEIWIKGPIMQGYWRREEATAQTLVDGWLRTGDVAVADDSGFLRIVDRIKDMIRSGAQNIYCKEIEDCLVEHPDVADVAVIGVPDPDYEEAVCAVIVLTTPPTDPEALAESVKSFVRERIAGYNVPRHVRFVEALPKNTLGKILKRELRDAALPSDGS